MAEAKVEVLYDAKARLGEGPCYDHVTGELIFVDILAETVNFFNLETQQNRYHLCVHGMSYCSIVSSVHCLSY